MAMIPRSKYPPRILANKTAVITKEDDIVFQIDGEMFSVNEMLKRISDLENLFMEKTLLGTEDTTSTSTPAVDKRCCGGNCGCSIKK